MNIGRMHILNKADIRTYSQLLVPTVAVVATFSKAYQYEEKNEQMTHLSNNLSTNFMAVALQSFKHGIFGVVVGAATLVRTFDERTKYDKVCSVVEDLSFIAAGVAVKSILNRAPFKHVTCYNKDSISRVLNFFYDICAFSIGTNLAAPKLEKFIRKIFVDPFVPRNPQSRYGKENNLNSFDKFELTSNNENIAASPLPISMDKFNLARLSMAKRGK